MQELQLSRVAAPDKMLTIGELIVTEHTDPPAFMDRLVAAGRRLLAAMLRGPARFDPPGEPEVPVREPRRRNPGGRNSSVALEEPQPPHDVLAIGRWPNREGR